MSGVRLVVVSAYPGAEEVRAMQSLSPSPKTVNAGRVLQMYIEKQVSKAVGFDLYHRTYRTNAMKCPPKGLKGDKLTQPRNVCKSWLLAELEEVPSRVPILLAGSDAVTSVLGLPLYESRGRVHYYGTHPVVVTINPIQVERSTRFTYSSTGDMIPQGHIKGSEGALWMDDLRLLATLVGNT
jgi:uracil-DNA glycosylase